MNPKLTRLIASFYLINIFLSCLSICLLSTEVQEESVDVLKYEVSEAFFGTLKHNIQITNPAINNVAGKFSAPLVKNETARHYVILFNISSSKGKPVIIRDGSGNMYALWNDVVINRNQTFIVELNYYVFSLSTRYIISPSLIGNYYNTSDLYDKYTQPEKLVQSDHPDIISAAQNITNSTNNPHEKVSRIYNYVITHLHFVAQEDEMGALWALHNGIGDCSEYSYLFVALCRAAGIPARIQAGFAFHTVGQTLNDGHMWTEYYMENYGWVPVDAAWRLFDTMDYRHFSSIQSLPELTTYVNYIFNSTEALALKDKQKITLQKCSSDVFGEASSFVENAYTAVQRINQAKFALFLSRIFGARLIFSSAAAKNEQYLLESQVNLQKAIDSWETQQIAETSAAEALENAEDALQGAWMLIAVTFILLIGILIIIISSVLVFIKRLYRLLSSSSSSR